MSSMRWFKFNPADYENDVDLLGCSLGAQGLWMRLLCYMHRVEPYGHLVVQGKAASLRQIAAIVRQREQAIRPLLEELAGACVYARSTDGIIYSRRMVRDFAQHERDRLNGLKGGNPQLSGASQPTGKKAKNKGVNGGVKGGVIPRVEKKRREKRFPDAIASGVRSADPTHRGTIVAFPQRDASDEQAAFDAWNVLASETAVSAANSLDPDRRVKLGARLRECGGLEGWAVAIEKVRHSPLWQGRVPGRDGAPPWVGGFDAILSKAKFRKLMEGAYDDRPLVQPAAGRPVRESAATRIARELEERETLESRTIEGYAS